MNLSKSRYCKGIQCKKLLWLAINSPDSLTEDDGQQGRFDIGNEVGAAAKMYFGEYTDVEYSQNKQAMIDRTGELIAAGTEVITEASFACGGLFCSVDILKVTPEGLELYEVKSSTGVKDVYYDDASFQYYVVERAGYAISRVCVMYINNEYVRRGELDLQRLFAVADVTDRVVALQGKVASEIEAIREYMAAGAPAPVELGEQCFSPYECPAWEYCTAAIPTPNVFDLPATQLKTKLRYYRDDMVTFEDLIDRGAKLSAKNEQFIGLALGRTPDILDRRSIAEFLDTLSYPLYFLDFETCQYAIPRFSGARPYEQTPFQYSLHIQSSPGALPEHREYLAQAGTDPRRGVAERLCADIPADVCVLAYNMSFEKGVIARLAETYPDLAGRLMAIHGNIRDLIIPFQKGYVVTAAMKGSASIKHVLPALFPDDPELDYANLDGVHHGAEAMRAFAAMEHMTPEEVADTRRALLAYCRLDTLAMVRILDKLRGMK